MIQSTKIKRLLTNRNFHLVLLVVIVLGVSLQSLILTVTMPDGKEYTAYNNYLIFKNSYKHLVNNESLYAAYPSEQWDLYKYTPTFALFMFPFHYLSDFTGLFLWNLLNLIVLYFAIRMLPTLNRDQRTLMFFFIVFEMVGNIMYEQSNALIAGLIVFSLIFMERDKPFWAAFFLVLSAYIKLFGIVAGILLLFYPKRIKAITYGVFWAMVLGILPGFFIGFKPLFTQYLWWIEVLQTDHGRDINFSLMGLFDLYLNIDVFNVWFVLGGALILLLPICNFNQYRDPGFRILMLSNALMWMLIFNHMAEPPTFIILMTGIALWYFPFKRGKLDLILLLLALTLISLTGLDFFPHAWRDEFFGPYKAKAFPGVLIWIKAILEALFPSIRPELKTAGDKTNPTTITTENSLL
jgi:hypothetical protein